MEADHAMYNFQRSVERIPEILNSQDSSFEEKDSVPARSALTFTNGFYVNVSALFVDMRGSKALATTYNRPTLAKIYRTYISELVAVLKGHSRVQEISIEGDGVWGVFNTPKKAHIDELFDVAAKVSSLVNILNHFYSKHDIRNIRIGIGLAYGRALMIKAGYKGSSIHDVVWAGDVVGEAAELCSYGNRTWQDGRMMLSDTIYDNLNEHRQGLCTRSSSRACYRADAIWIPMEDWLKEQ